MFDRLRSLLTTPDSGSPEPSERLATALLLTELGRSDFEFSEVEQAVIRDLLAAHFGLDGAGVDTLMREAREKADRSVSLHDYVQSLHQQLDADGKRALMTMLWQVANADGRIDKYEEHLLRRLADLLYIPMQDYIQIKLAVTGAD